MGDDIQMGQPNVAHVPTNLFAKAQHPLDPGDWSGGVVFNVDASNVLGTTPVDGIHAVGVSDGRGVVGIGSIGVVGSSPPDNPNLAVVGVFGETGEAIIFPPPLAPGFTNAGVLGAASGNAEAAGVIGRSDVGLGVYGLGGAGNPGVRGQGGTGNADGVQGFGTGTFSGVAGFGDKATNGTGVFGAGLGPQAPGVRGIGSGGPNTVPGNAVGVYGQAGAGNSNGVEGHGSGTSAGVSGLGDAGQTANSGIGVFAVGGAPPPNSSQPGGPGVQGFGFGSPLAPRIGGAFGVYGLSGTDGSPGVRGDGGTSNAAGVLGDSNLGAGVAGFSNAGEGVSGQSTSGFGVRGFSQQSVGVSAEGATGLVAKGNQLAAQFDGNVLVQGNFTVTGTKSAAIPFPDGSNRLLYCTESPESWFEDFGFGELIDGEAEVQLDPIFRSVVTTEPYHVFITEYGDNNGLYVSSRTSEGFAVRAKASARNGAFSYRVVAKRKGSLAPRFEKVSLA